MSRIVIVKLILSSCPRLDFSTLSTKKLCPFLSFVISDTQEAHLNLPDLMTLDNNS
jgi:hypothetical protein